jgi:tyrosine-protein kinase Etk/Wzc
MDSQPEMQTGTIPSLGEIVLKYLSYWRWFVISLVLCLSLAFVYVRYTVPMYEASATVLIKDDKNGKTSLQDELSAFEDLGILSGNPDLDNEIEILRSRTLMMEVINELHLNVRYYTFGRPIAHERYERTPIQLQLITPELPDSSQEFKWKLVPKTDTDYELTNTATGEISQHRFGDTLRFAFGYGCFRTTRHFSESQLNHDFITEIVSPEKLAIGFLENLKITAVNKDASVLKLVFKDALHDRAVAVLNTLIAIRNKHAIDDKNQISRNTANFINERIQFITDELAEVESEVETFKKQNRLTDIPGEADLMVSSGINAEQEILQCENEIALHQFLLDEMNNRNTIEDLLPANLGLKDESVNFMIWEYNKLVLEHNRLKTTAGEKNPATVALEPELSKLRASLRSSFENTLKTLKIKLDGLSKYARGINSKIQDVPTFERAFRDIQRQQQIKESLYLYLLQKREETNIALAVTVSNAKTIDPAYSNKKKISPKYSVIYGISGLFGLLLPIALLYLIESLNTKVKSKKDLNQLSVPYLGEIPEMKVSNTHLIYSNTDRSINSESFRLLRTNIDYLCSGVEEGPRVIGITSSIGKEGKSFLSINLAESLQFAGKKTILLGTDLRHPKLASYLNIEDLKGLSYYLSKTQSTPEEVIVKGKESFHFDLIASGPVPPNPSEMLMSKRFAELIETLKKNYDCIVVDTAPIGLVSDAYHIAPLMDCFVYIINTKLIRKSQLDVIQSLHTSGRLPRLGIVLNRYKAMRGYGYGYGYGYGNDYLPAASNKKKA